MEFFKKHLDTAFIVLSIITSVICINNNLNQKFTEVNQKFSEIEKDLAVIKAVLILKGIMPQELAKGE